MAAGWLWRVGVVLGFWGWSGAWVVVGEAGFAAAGAAGGCGGVLLGGGGAPCADLAEVGGHEQQGGEDGAGGDAADAAAGWLGEGLAGGVFEVSVEALDGVAEGGVAVVPGGGGE